MKFLREEHNLFWTVCGLLAWGYIIYMAVVCLRQLTTIAPIEPSKELIAALSGEGANDAK